MRWVVDGLPYPVIVSEQAASDVAAAIPQSTRAALVICDRRVEPRALLVGEALRRTGLELRDIIPIAAGERRKNQRTVTTLYRGLLKANVDRGTLIIAVGGGTLTDIAGFVAATFLRGVRWIAVPTTLLAMVDAAIGGKTGIDLPEGKNLVGTIWPPLAVVADLEALGTLPIAQRRSGLAEVIKAAIIADPALLETVRRQKLRAPAAAWAELITAAARVKVAVVAKDLHEQGPRALLNLGHTSAHAIEHASHYRVAHGPALSMGLRVAGIMARDATGWAQADHARVLRALRRAGLPLRLPSLAVSDIIAAMQHDKKRAGGKLNFVLPVRLGEVRTGVPVEERAVAAALQACFAAPEDGGW